jgi:hypothetical protein
LLFTAFTTVHGKVLSRGESSTGMRVLGEETRLSCGRESEKMKQILEQTTQLFNSLYLRVNHVSDFPQ